MKTGTILALLLGAGIVIGGTWWLTRGSSDSKRNFVKNYFPDAAWKIAVQHMTDAEVGIVYEFLTKYKDLEAAPQSAWTSVSPILIKYNIQGT